MIHTDPLKIDHLTSKKEFRDELRRVFTYAETYLGRADYNDLIRDIRREYL